MLPRRGENVLATLKAAGRKPALLDVVAADLPGMILLEDGCYRLDRFLLVGKRRVELERDVIAARDALHLRFHQFRAF